MLINLAFFDLEYFLFESLQVIALKQVIEGRITLQNFKFLVHDEYALLSAIEDSLFYVSEKLTSL